MLLLTLLPFVGWAQEPEVVEVQVTPTTSARLPYGTPADAIIVSVDWISTNNVPAFADADNKQLIADLLVVSEPEKIATAAAGTHVPFKLDFKNPEPEADHFVEIEGVRYIINPVGQGDVLIEKAKNELKEGNGISRFAFDLIQGIPYTGEPQNLVKPVSSTFNFTSFSGEGSDAAELGKGTAKVVRVDRGAVTITEIMVTKNEPAGTTTANDATGFVNQTFYVYADPSTIPTKRIQLYTYDEDYQPTGMWVSVEAGEESWAKFGEKEGVEFLTISKTKFQELMDEEEDPQEPENYVPAADDANWSTAIPQGTKIDEYYVWARPAAGANWLGGDAEFVPEYASIVTGKPTFSGEITGVEDEYFYDPGLTITPSGVTTTSDGPVRYQFRMWNPVANKYNAASTTFVPAVGTWQIYVEVKSTDLYEYAYTTKINKTFKVVTPKVTIQTTPATLVQAYNVASEFHYEITGWQGKSEATTDPAFNGITNLTDNNVKYVWYTNKECSEELTGTAAANQTYYVKAEPKSADRPFTTAYHEVVVLPAEVFVSPGEIVAHVEQDVNLVFGQNLPLNLTYETGAYAPESQDIEKFNKKTWSGYFKAKMIRDAEGKEVTENNPEKTLYDYSWTTWEGGHRTDHYQTTVLPVGTWEVTASDQSSAASNQLIVRKGIWTITPKNIKNKDFTAPGVQGNDVLNNVNNKYYTSQEITLNRSDFSNELSYRTDGNIRYGSLKLDEDFEITGYTNNIDAGTATVTIQGIGNFEGTRDMTFTIKKATVPVYPKADTWEIGGAEDKFEIDWAALRTYLNENFRYGKNIDFTKDNGFKALKAKRVVGATVGTHPAGLKAYAENDEKAENYEFNFKTAALEITKGKIYLAVKNIHVPYNGNATLDPTAIPFDLELAEGTTFLGTSKTLEEGWKVLVPNWNKVQFTVEEAEKYVVNTTGYTITATEDADNKLQATNYNVTITGTTGKLYIDPAQLTLKAKNRTLNARDFIKDGKYDEATKTAKINALKTIEAASVEATGLKGGDNLTDVVESIAINETTGVISLTPNENANYVTPTYEAETLIDGQLTINPLAGIVLTSDMAEYKKDKWGDVIEPKELIGGDKKTLAENNNLPVSSVTLLLKAPKLVNNDGEEVAEYSQWNKNQWHTLVLPFATTPRDISYAFPGEDSYVYVNVADSKNTEIGNVKFKLPDDVNEVIPANTPFCVKTAEAYDYTAEHTVMVGGAENQVEGILLTFNRNVDKYGPYVIVEPTDNIVKDETFENEWGYTFEGTYNQEFEIDYKKSYLRFLGPDNWKYILSTSTNAKYTLPPYYGYVNLGEGFAGTREVIFTFEEEDGSTTVIRDVDFMNGNKSAEGLYRVDGVKVQGTTTQKGVYIQDGKKFVK